MSLCGSANLLQKLNKTSFLFNRNHIILLIGEVNATKLRGILIREFEILCTKLKPSNFLQCLYKRQLIQDTWSFTWSLWFLKTFELSSVNMLQFNMQQEPCGFPSTNGGRRITLVIQDVFLKNRFFSSFFFILASSVVKCRHFYPTSHININLLHKYTSSTGLSKQYITSGLTV